MIKIQSDLDPSEGDVDQNSDMVEQNGERHEL